MNYKIIMTSPYPEMTASIRKLAEELEYPITIIEDTMMSAAMYISNDANAETKAFAAAYKKKFGQVADSHVAKAYDGAKMLLEAIDKAYPNIDGAHIRDALHQLKYHGLTGDFKFNAQGEGMFTAQIGTYKNGQPEPLQ